jgi:hypothetical protein
MKVRKAVRKTRLFPGAGMVLLFVCACGIEDYSFLNPVTEGQISRTAQGASITGLGVSVAESNYFTNYVIYYRIYISDMLEPGIMKSADQMTGINSALASDFSGLYSYTSSNANNSADTIYSSLSFFTNRRYYALELQGASVYDELRYISQLSLDFSVSPPVIRVDGDPAINLLRSTGGNSFTPKPEHRHFVNDPELYSSANATTTLNADTADKAGGSNEYTYVSLYIAKMGRDIQSLSPIYGVPAFIGVFALPDPL